MSESLQWLNTAAERLEALKDAGEPLPPVPVQDQREQRDWLSLFPPAEQFNIQKMMDGERERLGLPGLEVKRVDMMRRIQATNEAFDLILQDIRNNPEFPKGLAKRRIALFSEQSARIIKGFTNQLGIINHQIESANAELNTRWNIVTDLQSQRERRQDNARQFLSMIISGGALPALTDGDLRGMAAQVAPSPEVAPQWFEGLKKLRAAKHEELTQEKFTHISYKTDQATGNITAIGINKKTGRPEIITQLRGVVSPQQGQTPAAQFAADIAETSEGVRNLLASARTPQDKIERLAEAERRLLAAHGHIPSQRVQITDLMAASRRGIVELKGTEGFLQRLQGEREMIPPRQPLPQPGIIDRIGNFLGRIWPF